MCGKKKEKEQKSKQIKNVIRFTPNTDDHDLSSKRATLKILKEGAKVKAMCSPGGNMIQDRGELLLQTQRLGGCPLWNNCQPEGTPCGKVNPKVHSKNAGDSQRLADGSF